MTDTYFGKPVELNEHGNNAAIKVHILDNATMELNGFRWVNEHWYVCKHVFGDITFNMTIFSEDNWQIDILDENFLQPYDYQYMWEKAVEADKPLSEVPPAMVITDWNVTKIMESLKKAGIISGWEVGDYV